MSKSFRDLVAFRRAVDLMVEVYAVTKTFPREELYGLTSQLRRASVSVVSLIAEGQGRLTFGEWRQFLSQARGSLFEIDAELLAAERLGYLQPHDHERLMVLLRKTGRALSGLIRWVQKNEPRRGNPPSNQQPSNPATQ